MTLELSSNQTCFINYTASASMVEPVSMTAILISTVCGILITVINAFVLGILISDKVLRKDLYSALVLSLSITDFMVGISLTAVSVVVLSSASNRVSCFASFFSMFTSMSASNMQILLLCLVRIWPIKWPHHWHVSSKMKYITTAVCLIWAFCGIMYGIPSVFWIGTEEAMAEQCALFTAFIRMDAVLSLYACHALFVYGLVLVSFIYLMSLLRVVRVMPIATISHALASSKNSGLTTSAMVRSDQQRISRLENQRTMRAVDESNLRVAGRRNNRANRDSTKALTVIVVMLTILIVPPMVLFLIESNVTSWRFAQNVRMALGSFSCLNSIMNPIVYAFTLGAFKASVKRRLAKLREYTRRTLTLNNS